MGIIFPNLVLLHSSVTHAFLHSSLFLGGLVSFPASPGSAALMFIVWVQLSEAAPRGAPQILLFAGGPWTRAEKRGSDTGREVVEDPLINPLTTKRDCDLRGNGEEIVAFGGGHIGLQSGTGRLVMDGCWGHKSSLSSAYFEQAARPMTKLSTSYHCLPWNPMLADTWTVLL